jgi:hypothetical protein
MYSQNSNASSSGTASHFELQREQLLRQRKAEKLRSLVTERLGGAANRQDVRTAMEHVLNSVDTDVYQQRITDSMVATLERQVRKLALQIQQQQQSSPIPFSQQQQQLQQQQLQQQQQQLPQPPQSQQELPGPQNVASVSSNDPFNGQGVYRIRGDRPHKKGVHGAQNTYNVVGTMHRMDPADHRDTEIKLSDPWAVLMAAQAEVLDNKQRSDEQRAKELRQRMREDLERQIREREARQKEKEVEKVRDLERIQSAVRHNEEEERRYKEEQRRKKQHAASMFSSTVQEQQSASSIRRQQKLMEDQAYLALCEEKEQIVLQREQRARQRQRDMMQQARIDNEVQQRRKAELIALERAKDKELMQEYTRMLDKQERERQQKLQELHDRQANIEASGVDLRQIEEQRIREADRRLFEQMQAKAAREEKAELEKQRRQKQDARAVLSVVRKQVEAKQRMHDARRLELQRERSRINNIVSKAKQEQLDERRRAKQKQLEYRRMLQQQIEQDKARKAHSGDMSPTERNWHTDFVKRYLTPQPGSGAPQQRRSLGVNVNPSHVSSSPVIGANQSPSPFGQAARRNMFAF